MVGVDGSCVSRKIRHQELDVSELFAYFHVLVVGVLQQGIEDKKSLFA